MVYKSVLTVRPIHMRDNYTNFEHSDSYDTIRSVCHMQAVRCASPAAIEAKRFFNTVSFDQWSAFLDNAMLDMHGVIITGPRLLSRNISGHRQFRLNNAAGRAACEAGVGLHRPTHRGCRWGARKQRPIHVIVSTRPTVALSDTNCVNYDTLHVYQ